jgi:hypothetical protein
LHVEVEVGFELGNEVFVNFFNENEVGVLEVGLGRVREAQWGA